MDLDSTLGKKVVVNKRTSYFVLIAAGIVSLNIFLIQAPLPVVAIVPDTPTPTSTTVRSETPNNNRNTNPKQSVVSLTPTPQTYVVQAGENIYRIAQKFYGDSAKYSFILEANKLNENARIVAGTVLKIPYQALPTLTATRTATPSATTTVDLTTATQISAAQPTQAADPNPRAPVPGGQSDSGDDPAIVALLLTFALTTLVGSSIVCGIFAIWVYKNARRAANQQAMARRVRPPLRR